MVGNNQNRTLTTLAILKVNSDHLKSDYLDLLKPFIATLIKKKEYSEIELPTIREDFKDEFGLDIPHHAFVSILNRCRKEELLNKSHGQLKPNYDNLLEYDFSIESEKEKTKQKQFINKFIEYADENFDRDYENKQAEEILLEYLKKHDIELLFASQNSSLLPRVKSDDKEGLFILADFIKHVCENEYELSEFLLDINIGHLLANTFAYDGFSNYKGKLRGVSIYFDSPVIFKLLGFDGDEQKEIIIELVELIQEQGGKVKIFEITRDEIEETLEAAKHWINSPNYDPTLASRALRYFKENNKKESDIHRVILSLDRKLDLYNIQHESISEDQKKNQYQIDLEKLKNIILDHYGDYYNENSRGLIHDEKCISNIYHLRKGKEVKSISNSNALFVTTNYTLAKASNNFEREKSTYNESIPAIVSDIFLGTILWLQKPAIVEKISRKKLISDCYAALKPDISLVKKYIDEIKTLEKEGYVKEEESYLLRTSRVALNMLSKQTLGDADNYTAGTAKDIYDEIKNEIREEARKEFKEERKDHLNTKERLSEKEETEERVKSVIDIISQSISHGIFIVLFLVIGFALFNSLFIDPTQQSLFWKIIYGLIAIFALIGEINLWRIRDRTRRKVKAQLKHFFSIKS